MILILDNHVCKKNSWVRYSLKVLINHFMYLVVVVYFFNSVKNQMGRQGVEVFSKNDVIIANL